MIDGIIDGNGTSRKVFANFPATYEEFRMQAAAGTLQMDVLFNAAGWQQQPDFLNQKNLLQEGAALDFDLDPQTGLLGDALKIIGRLNKGICNEHIWARKGTMYIPVAYTGTAGFLKNGDVINYSTNVIYDEGAKKFVLDSPVSVTLDIKKDYPFLTGMYIAMTDYNDGEALKCESFSTVDLTFEYQALAFKAQSKSGILEYVNSFDPDAYPPLVSDGYSYSYIGQLGTKPSFIKGSYTGNGHSTKSITFDSEIPSILLIYKENVNLVVNNATYVVYASGMKSATVGDVDFPTKANVNFSVSGKTLTLTADGVSPSLLAMNESGREYYYIGLM